MRWNTKLNILRSTWRRHTGAGGFTLVELLIVIVILAVAAAIVVPMASSAASMQLRSAGNMVASDLEYAKSMAIATGQQYRVEFNTGDESYELLKQDGSSVPHPVTKQSRYLVSFSTNARLNQVDIASADLDGAGATTVSFDYLGTPYSGGTALSVEGVITLQAGDSSKTVRVQPVTGFVSVSD